MKHSIEGTHISPLDMPYVCMRVHGQADSVIDRHGNVLPDTWTGLCVTAVSTKDFWMVSSTAGKRTMKPIGRFQTVVDAVASLSV